MPDLRSNPEDRIVSLRPIAEHTAMPKYNFLLCSGRSRVKYPKSFHLTDIEAARQVGFRIARSTREVVPHWNDLTSDQQKNFAVEVVDGAGQTVLTVPCRKNRSSGMTISKKRRTTANALVNVGTPAVPIPEGPPIIDPCHVSGDPEPD